MASTQPTTTVTENKHEPTNWASTKPVTTVTEHEAKQPGSQPKSLWEIIPWTGLASLGAMVLCAIASATVVGVASGKIADSWSIQPAVILAILSAISNIAFNSAMATGIAVRFWLYASRDAHLSQLHYIWDHGRGFGFLSALRAGSEARTVAVLATIAYITQFASGPLVQRSVEQTVAMFENTQSIKMDVATRIPDGWLGPLENDHVIGYLNGIPQAQAIARNVSIQTRVDPSHPGYTCNGTCYASVKGAGFAHQCSTTYTHLDMANVETNNEIVFSINSTRLRNPDSQDKAYMLLTILYVSDVNTSCISTITITKCHIDAAVVSYPVMIQNSTITLRANDLSSMRILETYTSKLDLPGQDNGTASGPLGGLGGLHMKFGDRLWNQAVKTYRPNSTVVRTVYQGPDTTIADNFIQVQSPQYADANGPMRKCALTWADPTSYILNYMHEFMFRSAIRIGMNGTSLLGTPPAPGEIPEHQQTLEALQLTPQSVFVITPSYLGAGIAAMVIAAALVITLMWGWWRLRRSVTLSPLETVTALVDAPQLRDMPPDTTLRQILSRVDTGTATGSVRSGEESPRSPVGFGLRKTLTSRSNSSKQHTGRQFSARPLRKASTFAGTESVSGVVGRTQREGLRGANEVGVGGGDVGGEGGVSVDGDHSGDQVGRTGTD